MFKVQVAVVTLVLALSAPLASRTSASGASAAIVYEWNQILQDTVPTPHNPLTPRYFSMMHIAMFDAVNAIERDFTPYRVSLRYAGGSAEAAAAQAAHDVLVAMLPAATATYDAALARQLGQQPSGFTRRGAAVGAHVAKEILEWRKTDGWVVSPFPPYSEPLVPGRWQPTPPNNPTAAFTHLQNAAPMALLTATQFLPPPPPSLTSERYAADLNEVAEIGKSDSASRTAEQTAIARLWAGIASTGSGTATNFMSIWNNIARDVSTERRLSLVDAARVFVLVNVSVHDALQTAQASKFVYGLWRPVTAVREAETNLNPATAADPTWLPLLTTPPYPSYAGNMAVDWRERGPRAAARIWHQRRRGDGDVAAVGRAAGCLAPVPGILAGRGGAIGEPDLRRHSLPLRSGGGSAVGPRHRRVRRRALHGASARIQQLRTM